MAPTPAALAKRPTPRPDADAQECDEHGCEVRFGLLNHRHACKGCGFVYCSAHLSEHMPIPAFGYDAPVPVCHSCFTSGVDDPDTALAAPVHGAAGGPKRERRERKEKKDKKEKKAKRQASRATTAADECSSLSTQDLTAAATSDDAAGGACTPPPGAVDAPLAVATGTVDGDVAVSPMNALLERRPSIKEKKAKKEKKDKKEKKEKKAAGGRERKKAAAAAVMVTVAAPADATAAAAVPPATGPSEAAAAPAAARGAGDGNDGCSAYADYNTYNYHYGYGYDQGYSYATEGAVDAVPVAAVTPAPTAVVDAVAVNPAAAAAAAHLPTVDALLRDAAPVPQPSPALAPQPPAAAADDWSSDASSSSDDDWSGTAVVQAPRAPAEPTAAQHVVHHYHPHPIPAPAPAAVTLAPPVYAYPYQPPLYAHIPQPVHVISAYPHA